MDVSPEIERRIDALVASGGYTSSGEVLRQALDLLEEESRERDALRGELDRRYDELRSGEVEPISAEEARRTLKQRHKTFLARRA